MSKYETTNAQYAEFLNAKAATDPNGLFNAQMQDDATFGGVTRSGSSGSYIYSAKTGFADKPVVYVSLYDAQRFANWLNNGQGNGDTETGAYTITLAGIANDSIQREAIANTFVPNEDEWYKAAYFRTAGRYWEYPTGSDALPSCAAPTATPNSANCGGAVGALTDVGAYTGSPSFYGTFDQGGNVDEWTETTLPTIGAVVRGGSWYYDAVYMGKGESGLSGYGESEERGFRVATLIPEPGTGFLVAGGLLGLAGRRRRIRRRRETLDRA